MWIKEGSLFKDKRFNEIPGVIQFTTGREEGNLREKKVRQNFIKNYSFTGWALGEQVHGSGISLISDPFSGEKIYPAVDGLVVGHKSIALGVFTADCVPVFFIDSIKKIVAIAHAGREGVCKGIVNSMVRFLIRECGCLPYTLLVSLGPHLGPCCYTVEGKKFDLKQEIVSQLIIGGIRKENIVSVPWCTAHETRWFFSYRKESRTENRMFSVIGII